MSTLPGTWYAKVGGRRAEFFTILHPPYTGMVLCFVLLGALLAPQPNWFFLVLSLLAYALGLGVGAHSLDELSGHPWGTAFSDFELKVMAFFSLTAAAAVGAAFALFATPWFWPFIAAGLFFALAYSAKSFAGGRFHSDAWFVLSWAALPFLTSFFVQTQTITPASLVMAAALMGLAGLEILLSRWVKEHRRAAVEATDEERQHVLYLIDRPQRALKLVVITTYVLTAAVAAVRYF